MPSSLYYSSIFCFFFHILDRGPEGSSVKLTIQSGSEIKQLALMWVWLSCTSPESLSCQHLKNTWFLFVQGEINSAFLKNWSADHFLMHHCIKGPNIHIGFIFVSSYLALELFLRWLFLLSFYGTKSASYCIFYCLFSHLSLFNQILINL